MVDMLERSTPVVVETTIQHGFEAQHLLRTNPRGVCSRDQNFHILDNGIIVQRNLT